MKCDYCDRTTAEWLEWIKTAQKPELCDTCNFILKAGSSEITLNFDDVTYQNYQLNDPEYMKGSVNFIVDKFGSTKMYLGHMEIGKDEEYLEPDDDWLKIGDTYYVVGMTTASFSKDEAIEKVKEFWAIQK